MRRFLAASFSLALVAGLAACGGDDDDRAQPYVDALTTNIVEDDSDELSISEDDAPCVAEAWVDIVTVEAFEEAGVEPEDIEDPDSDFSGDIELDLQQGRDMVTAVEDCGVGILDQTRDLFAEGLSPEQQECVNAELDDDVLIDLIAAGVVDEAPPAEAQAELERIDAACPGA